MSTDSFSALGIQRTATIDAALAEAGIHTPTPPQASAIPAVLAGEHVLVHTGTGTGKTLAYLLPLLQQLRENPGRAVVFAPGAELAMQTLRVARSLADEALTTGAAITTSSRKRQKQRLGKSTRLIVGTPDRLIELFEGGKLKDVRWIVFDELEPILAARNAGFLDTLLRRSTPKRQLIVAAATLGPRSQRFLQTFLSEAVRIELRARPLLERITHHRVRCSASGKDVRLARFLGEQGSTALVFANEPRLQSHLYHHLNDQGIATETLNHTRSKRQREQALTRFRRGAARVLLVTDATARGIDIPALDWVLHYSLPRSPEAYVHRAGRTGRAGRDGRSVVFVEPREVRHLERLGNALGLTFAPWTTD